MVPTWTMLGRLTPTCCCGVSAKEAVATGVIMALPGLARPGGREDSRARVPPGLTSGARRARPRLAADTIPGSRPLPADAGTADSHPARSDDDGDAHGQHACPRRARG